ncbi:MAG: hypothetical protein OYH77_08450 [Pseudomonadota bacterium]|nr:hypothetical protein [Pseudomonadota bacterium]
MTNTDHIIDAEARQATGKGIARKLRRVDKIPAVIVTAGKESRSISLNPNLLGKVWGSSRRFTLNLDGKQMPAKLHAVQIDPVRRIPLHADIMLV